MSNLADFVPHTRIRSLQTDEVLFREDEEADGRMYVLLDGEIRIARRGKEFERIAERGGVLGEIGLIDKLPRTATASATQPTRLAEIDDQEFRSLILRSPSFALEIMRMLTRRARASLTI